MALPDLSYSDLILAPCEENTMSYLEKLWKIILSEDSLMPVCNPAASELPEGLLTNVDSFGFSFAKLFITHKFKHFLENGRLLPSAPRCSSFNFHNYPPMVTLISFLFHPTHFLFRLFWSKFMHEYSKVYRYYFFQTQISQSEGFQLERGIWMDERWIWYVNLETIAFDPHFQI